MQKKEAFSITELLALVATVCILAVILMPVIIRAKSSIDERCQYNMKRIGSAILMYQNDWNDITPTNRQAPPWSAWLSPMVQLSNPGTVDPNGQPVRFQYGVNWVEALYPYLDGERAVATTDPCVWRCPAADKRLLGGYFSAVTYAFNINLIEKPKSVAVNPEKLMMVREMAGYYDAVLRPTNLSVNPYTVPIDPFLDSFEGPIQYPNYRPHDEGSHILFADGSVKYFSAAYYSGSPVCVWDGAESRWYNNPGNAQPGDIRIKAIAVTP